MRTLLTVGRSWVFPRPPAFAFGRWDKLSTYLPLPVFGIRGSEHSVGLNRWRINGIKTNRMTTVIGCAYPNVYVGTFPLMQYAVIGVLDQNFHSLTSLTVSSTRGLFLSFASRVPSQLIICLSS